MNNIEIIANNISVGVHILLLGFGSVNLQIFADPDPGSHHVPDLTDPDSKHCLKLVFV